MGVYLDVPCPLSIVRRRAGLDRTHVDLRWMGFQGAQDLTRSRRASDDDVAIQKAERELVPFLADER